MLLANNIYFNILFLIYIQINLFYKKEKLLSYYINNNNNNNNTNNQNKNKKC